MYIYICAIQSRLLRKEYIACQLLRTIKTLEEPGNGSQWMPAHRQSAIVG